MPQSYRSAVIPAPIEKVWAVARRFDGLPAWHPAIASSTLDAGEEGQVGAVRRLTTPDGGVIVERLLALDDEAHRLTYAIVDSPFAVRRSTTSPAEPGRACCCRAFTLPPSCWCSVLGHDCGHTGQR